MAAAGHVVDKDDSKDGSCSRRQQLLNCLSALAASESQRWSSSNWGAGGSAAVPNPTHHHHLTYWDSSDREALAGDTSRQDTNTTQP